MALIYFYDATELDKQQLTEGLMPTDHHWEYVQDKISDNNLNPDTEVVSVFVTSTVNKEIMDKLPNLKLIACRSTGFNNVDLAAASERGITVVNVPTYGEVTVAEYTFALLLSLSRKIPTIIKSSSSNILPNELNGWDLSDKTIGVIGTGHIGQKVIAIANGFGMKVIAYDKFPNEKLKQNSNFEYTSLDDLLTTSDIVTLHVPYFAENNHLLGKEQLESMKKGSYLVNTARGELVDTKALVDLLQSNHLAGAALDVIEGEELLKQDEEVALLRSGNIKPADVEHSIEISLLKKTPNVIISPHNAYNTVEAINRINQTTAKNIIDFWYGLTPNKVKPTRLPSGRLLLVRHAESEWNATGQWTGRTDVHLSEKGFKEARQLGDALKSLNLQIDAAYYSEQIRTKETLELMLASAGMSDVPSFKTEAVNERDYGEYTGKNKWQMKDLLGDEKFNQLRRGWNVEVPNGETLKTVYERAIPFYQNIVVPKINTGENVLIVAHGNSIRALMKYIQNISDDEVGNLEMIFGQIEVLNIDKDGRGSVEKIVKIDTTPPNA